MLSNLKQLYLSNNPELTGEIPAELGGLSSLTHLSLWGDNLTGQIPMELGDLGNLTHLLLGGNSFTGCIPAGLRDVANNDLDNLGLSDCPAP